MPLDDPLDEISTSQGLRAIAMPTPSFHSLRQRGQIGPELLPRRATLSHHGFLALAAYRAMTESGIEIRELNTPGAFYHWADLWLRTRDTAKPVRELVIRYYGRPDDPNSKVSLLPNEDVLPQPPSDGAKLTLRFDLDVIFRRAEQELGPEPGRGPEREVFGLDSDDA